MACIGKKKPAGCRLRRSRAEIFSKWDYRQRGYSHGRAKARKRAACIGQHNLKSSVFAWRTWWRQIATALAMAKTKNPDPPSYEAALEELEQLIARIESGQMPLDQLLSGYQRGASLLAFCRERLAAVQDQIKVLDEGGAQPWTAQ